jgi:L-iduronidase
VRIHYLISLLQLQSEDARKRFPSADFDPATDFNYKALDAGLDLLVGLGLSVGFEFMGNPGQINSGSGAGGIFTDFSNADELRVWRDLAKAIATRYVGRYGIDVVGKWKFQMWNEPDHRCNSQKQMGAGIECNGTSYIRWFDALQDGLKLAHPRILFGGPNSGGNTLTPSHRQPALILDLLLEHVVRTNRSMDFINWHHKGGDVGQVVTDGDIEIIEHIATKYPSLAGIPMQNDEGDPQGGWSSKEDWRGDARYAAVVAKIVNQHLTEIVQNSVNRPLLKGAQWALNSNDNGFLNYGSPDHVFLQRTLVARFMLNRTMTIQTVRKPVLNTMGMLSFLGDVSHPVAFPLHAANSSDVGVIATSIRSSSSSSSSDGDTVSETVGEVAVLLYRSHDNATCAHDVNGTNITLTLHGLQLPSLSSNNNLSVLAVTYMIDNSPQHDPLANWTAMGSPTYPSPSQFTQLRAAAEIRTVSPLAPFPPQGRSTRAAATAATAATAPVSLSISLPCPSVAVLHICAPPPIAPLAPTALRLEMSQVEGGSPDGPLLAQVLVHWNAASTTGAGAGCLRTYEVLWSASNASNPAVRVNPTDTIFQAYVHTQPNSAAAGCYQVRAVDYWGRNGELSTRVCLQV